MGPAPWFRSGAGRAADCCHRARAGRAAGDGRAEVPSVRGPSLAVPVGLAQAGPPTDVTGPAQALSLIHI
eukprot:7427928-Alexandrium_andersonii.AAC.1